VVTPSGLAFPRSGAGSFNIQRYDRIDKRIYFFDAIENRIHDFDGRTLASLISFYDFDCR
jgi:hypothetical protein